MTGYGGFWRRLAAFLLDQGILAAIALYLFLIGLFALIAATGSLSVVRDLFTGNSTPITERFLSLFPAAVFLCAAVYFIFFWGYAGQTPGKMLLGLHVIEAGGAGMNYRLAIIRFLGYLLSAFAFYLGFLWMLFNRKRRGWPDLLAGTLVVYVPRTSNEPVLPAEQGEREEGESGAAAPPGHGSALSEASGEGGSVSSEEEKRP